MPEEFFIPETVKIFKHEYISQNLESQRSRKGSLPPDVLLTKKVNEGLVMAVLILYNPAVKSHGIMLAGRK